MRALRRFLFKEAGFSGLFVQTFGAGGIATCFGKQWPAYNVAVMASSMRQTLEIHSPSDIGLIGSETGRHLWCQIKQAALNSINVLRHEPLIVGSSAFWER